ncbi:hypothetical protein JDM601_0400 [Mycolicibacter sinensis]|uniref:Uncharacterized protein n=1 Tax=Mycolicibacter sinensis (strain JDM601) TaxID=875328 RepID=F5Z0L1_MYCSD|nr:hypothetical protein JDM601_0400 [Mycolicibacter sinensis]
MNPTVPGLGVADHPAQFTQRDAVAAGVRVQPDHQPGQWVIQADRGDPGQCPGRAEHGSRQLVPGRPIESAHLDPGPALAAEAPPGQRPAVIATRQGSARDAGRGLNRRVDQCGGQLDTEVCRAQRKRVPDGTT